MVTCGNMFNLYRNTVNRRRLVWLVGRHQRKAANMLRIKGKNVT